MLRNRTTNIRNKLCQGILNRWFCGTHFFRLKRCLLRFAGMRIGSCTKIVGPVYISSGIEIGDNCWIGMNLAAHGNGHVRIGNDCDLAPEVMFLTGSHQIGARERRAGAGLSSSIQIGDACWIGARATILGGVAVGSGSVIGACALVNRSIENDVLVAGVPAKKIRSLEPDASAHCMVPEIVSGLQ